jgi:hypothetical protein
VADINERPYVLSTVDLSKPPYAGSTVAPRKRVPIVSSYRTGPLGLLHLPRMWLKALLLAKDMLADDWGCGAGGLDKRMMDPIGVDKVAFMAWLTRELPSYAETEAWLAANARDLNAESIARSNAVMLVVPLPPGLNAQFQAFMQLDASVENSIMLNNYDDWHTIHHQVFAEGFRERLIPALSPLDIGTLGVPQLPRLWLKATLRAANALHPTYELAFEDLDDCVLQELGIDRSEADEYLATHRPTYLEFEQWIVEHATRSPAGIDWASLPGLDRASVDAVQSYDWSALHEEILAAPLSGTAGRIGIMPFAVSGRLKQ